MKSVDTGRFCDRCQKTVVDFSGLTDLQVADVLAQPAGSTCGRFRLSQLNRTVHVPAPTSHVPGRFFSLLTVGLLGYQAVRAETQSRLVVPATTQASRSSTILANQPVINEATSTDSLRVISGRVIEKVSEMGLAGVSVVLKQTSIGVSTDATGYFNLRIPMEHKNELITLVVAYIGFQSYEVQLRPDQVDPLLISLHEGQTLLGEVIVVGGYKKLPFWKRLMNCFRTSH
jgi:hypothetical protein